jgi:filamentous hemagglutinin
VVGELLIKGKSQNYNQLPERDIGKHSGIKNYKSSPLFTK